uniref:non-specific serine/threonine protein kinase n=1 Tax=Cyprinus carpio carpio TaxID=630221 RepID=A0A8C1AG76_CYPCA
MGLFSRLKKVFKVKRAHEPQPCVPLRNTAITAQIHPHRLDETPGGADAIDDGRKEAGRREKKKKRFWRCRLLHFFHRRAGTYNVAKAEKIHDLHEAPTSEVLPAVEEQLEQDVLQPQDVHTPVSLTEEDKAEDLDKGKITPGHPRRLPIEIGLTLMANNGPSVLPIIKILDWQDDPDHYVMVLERPMPSMSMFNFMKLRQRLDEKIARHVMLQVIHAANICCERGVFHRDIKLENLLVNPDTLEVKLIDFGCGTFMKDSAYMAFNGTEMFCPPEFDVDGRYHAKPATVWSLGFLLFVMLYGYYPDDRDLHRISEKDWSEPDLSQEYCRMIYDCLQPDPQRRLILEEMQLHDWFTVLRLESKIC